MLLLLVLLLLGRHLPQEGREYRVSFCFPMAGGSTGLNSLQGGGLESCKDQARCCSMCSVLLLIVTLVE